MNWLWSANEVLLWGSLYLAMQNYTIKFIDLFAGLGGIRIGFEEAAAELGLSTKCVFTSEIKDSALKAYQSNFNEKNSKV